MTYRVIEASKPATKYGLPVGRSFTTLLAAMIAAELWHSAVSSVCVIYRGTTEVYRSTGSLTL